MPVPILTYEQLSFYAHYYFLYIFIFYFHPLSWSSIFMLAYTVALNPLKNLHRDSFVCSRHHLVGILIVYCGEPSLCLGSEEFYSVGVSLLDVPL